MKEVIGLIGLGLVGAALAERLLASGYRVVGYDTEAAKRAALVVAGGEEALSPAEVAGEASRVLLSLPTSRIVRQVVEGENGILSAICCPKTIIDTTTGDPNETEALAAQLAEQGIAYLDATLSGSSEQVRQRTATLMVGGTPAAYAANQALFACITDRVFHVGPPGSGSRAKLASNLVLGLNRLALAEGVVFAEALGLDLGAFLEVLRNSPAYSVAMDTKGQKMLNSEFSPESRIRQHLKDVELILAYAHQAEQTLPLTEAHQRLLAESVAVGEGELDNAAVIQALRRQKRVC